jgi:penicillin-binding protein 1C
VETCRAHRRVAVDARTGRAASFETPRRFVELRTVVDLPPRYAAWSAAAALPRLGASGPIEPTHAALRPTRARLWIATPENGLRVLRDPETPAEQATLGLRAVADPPVPQVVWYVDGRPYVVAEAPYTARWPLAPGDHVIEARLPNVDVRSGRVTVHVE